jgi:hypothetical protein
MKASIGMGARFGIGNVVPEKRSTLFPFFVFVRLWQPFQDAPTSGHRLVRIAHYVRSDVAKRTSLALHTPSQLIDSTSIDSETKLHRLIDHPKQWEFRETALLLEVSSTNVGVYSRKPNLQSILGL